MMDGMYDENAMQPNIRGRLVEIEDYETKIA